MQVPGPDTRVVELRVHGILGTKPHDLTDSVASVDVAGDGVGRIVRPADRLLRPVPGPALSAGERTVPRMVEGYVWGEMTAGGMKAVWALLFPFALANMAHWMLPPSRQDSPTSRALGTVLRALVRLAALLLTMLFVAQITLVSLDLLAAQCLSPGSGCMSAIPDGLRGSEVTRSMLGLGAVLAVIVVMRRIAAGSWRVLAPKTQDARHSAHAPVLPGGNVVTDPETPALRALHTTAALCTASLVALGGPFRAAADPRWVGAAVLLGVCVLGTLVLDDPSGSHSRSRHRVRAVLGKVPRRSLVTAAAVVLLATAIAPARLSGPLPGSGSTIDALTVAMLAVCLAVGLLLVPAALLARKSWTGLPRHLRPWAGGWMAAPVLLIACLLGEGFGAGLALGVRQLLGRPGLVLPLTYDSVTLFWGTTTALIVLAGLLAVPWAYYRWWRATRADDAVSPEVALLHAGRQQDQHRAAGAWQWAKLQRRYSHHLLPGLAALLVAGSVVSLTLRGLGTSERDWANWLIVLGVGTLGTLALALLRMVHLAIKRPEAARQVGVFCDLALFWPREAHPVVPPCYALKVIPELVGRATEHLSEPDTRVVLVGHSQGSLLAAVAAARLLDSLPEADRERVGLVTAGSQLQWGYSRAFPGVVAHDTQQELTTALGGRWRSLCRGTDPLGGAVSTWNRQVYDGKLLGVGFRPDGNEGPLPPATRGPTGALVLGGDHWLPDPQRGPFAHRRWVPGVLRHTEYSGDPEWDRAVAMAAGLEMPLRGASLPLRTPQATPVSAAKPDGIADFPAAEAASNGHDGSSQPTAGVLDDRERPAEGDLPATELPEESAPESAAARDPEPQRPAGELPPTADPPEVVEPRGSTPPWERGPALRPTE